MAFMTSYGAGIKGINISLGYTRFASGSDYLLHLLLRQDCRYRQDARRCTGDEPRGFIMRSSSTPHATHATP
jgi:hypothetical protein